MSGPTTARASIAWVSTFTLLFGAAQLCGCGGAAGGAADVIGLSATEVDPGGFVTITHPAILADQEVIADFRQPGGAAVSVHAKAKQNGSVRVCVPPVLDAATSLPIAGTLEVSLQGYAARQSLQVRDLADVGELLPGSAVQAAFESAIEDYQAIANDLADPTSAFTGLTGTSAAAEEVQATLVTLQAMVDQLRDSGELTVTLPDGSTATLSGDKLRLMDRWVVSTLLGMEAEIATPASPNGRVAEARDCFENLPDGYTGDQYAACVRQTIQHVKDEANVAGGGWGGVLASGTGMVIFLGGLATGASEAVLITGAVVSVIGCVQGFLSANSARQNTDAIMRGDGGRFSASGEVLSQTARYAVGVISAPVSTALTIKDLNAAAATARCTDPNSQRSLSISSDDFCSSCDCVPDAQDLDSSNGNQDGGSANDNSSGGGTTGACSSVSYFASIGATNGPVETPIRVVATGVDERLCAKYTSFDCSLVGLPERTRPIEVCGTETVQVFDDNGNNVGSFTIPFSLIDGRGSDLPWVLIIYTPGVQPALSATIFFSETGDTVDLTVGDGGGTACLPEDCPTPTGGCCVDGVCTEESEADCTAASGTYAGDDVACADMVCRPPEDYVVWHTGNVCCWGAPLVYISTRSSFEAEAPKSSYPGGGIDSSIPVTKVELQSGFATSEDAQAWLCPQVVSRFNHYWCGSGYVQMNGANWQIGACDTSNLPVIDNAPDTDMCQ